MQKAMFATEIEEDERSTIKGGIYQAYARLLEEVSQMLAEGSLSAHELYEHLTYKRFLRPGHFREFKKFLRWAVREGHMDKNRLVSQTVKGTRIPNRFTKEQLVEYFRTCDDPRIAVASFLGLWSGLRIGDVTKLKIEDFDFEREVVKVVQSKRKKDRISPFLNEGQLIIEKWVQYSGATDYLFPSQESHSMATINEPHISTRTISNGFNKVVSSAGLKRVDERYNLDVKKKKKFTFHTFRHTFCTHHLENEVSAALVSRAAGHAKMDTTVNVYGHMSTGNLVRAFRKSFEKGRKEVAIPKPRKQKTSGFDPIRELTEKFISGEISEDVFRRKKETLEAVGL